MTVIRRAFGTVLGWTLSTPLGRWRPVAEINARLNLGYLAGRLVDSDRSLDRSLRSLPPPSARISVITPTFGIRAQYIRELVASLRRQTWPTWELCVCADGDPDPAVAALLEELVRSCPARFKTVAHPTNRGISAATRTALQLATGDVFAFVDADDTLHPRALEAVARRFASSDEIDVVYTDHDIMTDWGHRLAPSHKPAWSPELLLHLNYINHLLAVRRGCFERCDDAFADDVNGTQDWDLCLRLARQAARVSHLPHVLYHWRGRPGSVAAGGMAKPWAFEASIALLHRHVASLDLRLVSGPPLPGRFYGNLGIKPGMHPPVHHIRVGDAVRSAAIETYPGPIHERTVSPGTSLFDLAVNLDKSLEDAAPEDILLFSLPTHPPLEGLLDNMVAFCLLPRVACVWPFRDPKTRLAYTLDAPGSKLVQISSRRATHSSSPGNVLCGPLHTLTTRAEVVRRAGGFAGLLRDGELDGHADGDALGAVLALSALQRGMRNASTGGATCPALLTAVPMNRLPTMDPYA